MTEADNTQRVRLADYALEVGNGVAVFLLVTVNDDGQRHGPELYAGTVLGATDRVLILRDSAGGRCRVPWAAIAAIEDSTAYDDEAARPPKHPGLE